MTSIDALSRVDYTDRFTQVTDAQASPEQWARAMFGDVPSAGQQVIWHGVLGLRLSRGRSSETIAGWRITDRGPDRIRLEAVSWFLTADMLIEPTAGEVSLTTSVRYDHRAGRLVWPAASILHRRLVPGVLAGAAAKIQRRSGCR
jgi:hypothetical protein